MKANSRRRVLISSLAMLLVAIVALGTATYAWFTASTTTTANGLNVKTVQSSELVISKKDKIWGQTIDYKQTDKVLRPTSSADGTNWFAATAASKLSYAKDGNFVNVNAEKGSYVFVEQLNVANKGVAAVENVTITVTGFDNNYGRIALVEVGANGEAIEGKTFANSVYDTEGELYAAANGTTETANITPSKTLEINVGKLDGKAADAPADAIGAAKYYNLYVWFEGQDTDCYDTNAGQPIGDITFSISGKTVEQ